MRATSLLLALVLAVPAAAEPPAPRAEPDVTILRSAAFTRVEAVLPGHLVSWALPLAEGDRRDVLLLVAPGPERTVDEDEDSGDDDAFPPCPADIDRPGLELYRLDTDGAGRLVALRRDLPHDITRLASADLDADGRDELLLGRRGALFSLDGSGAGPLRSLIEDSNLAWWRVLERNGRPRVASSGISGFGLYGPEADGEWGQRAHAELPLQGVARRSGIVVRSPGAIPFGQRSDGNQLYATALEPVGARRLRTSVIEVSPTDATEVVDCWLRLPVAEYVLGHHFLMLDDGPGVVLTSMPSDKISLFGEKRLRVYRLEPDRSRLGHLPILATESEMNLWQEALPTLLDVTGDGRRDLVLAYWKGLKDAKVVLDVYAADAEGSFARAPRTTAFNVKGGDRSWLRYGTDLTGDGLVDLLLRTKEALLLYPGVPTRRGERLVARDPLRLPLGIESEGPSAVNVTVGTGGVSMRSDAHGRGWALRDLDADGRPEIVWAGRGTDRAVVRIFSPHTAALVDVRNGPQP